MLILFFNPITMQLHHSIGADGHGFKLRYASAIAATILLVLKSLQRHRTTMAV